jgi:hypothetical protein
MTKSQITRSALLQEVVVGPGQVGTSTTTSGFTQCTLESWSGEPKRLSRGGGSSHLSSLSLMRSAGDHPLCSSRGAARRYADNFPPIGPADDDELLSVEALCLLPDPSVVQSIRLIGPCRDGAFDTKLAGLYAERGSLHSDAVRPYILRYVACTIEKGIPALPALALTIAT